MHNASRADYPPDSYIPELTIFEPDVIFPQPGQQGGIQIGKVEADIDIIDDLNHFSKLIGSGPTGVEFGEWVVGVAWVYAAHKSNFADWNSQKEYLEGTQPWLGRIRRKWQTGGWDSVQAVAENSYRNLSDALSDDSVSYMDTTAGAYMRGDLSLREAQLLQTRYLFTRTMPALLNNASVAASAGTGGVAGPLLRAEYTLGSGSNALACVGVRVNTASAEMTLMRAGAAANFFAPNWFASTTDNAGVMGGGDRKPHKFSGKKVTDILKGKKGTIRQAPLESGSPTWQEVSNMTWEEIETAASQNKPGFKTIKKLLTDGRFNK